MGGWMDGWIDEGREDMIVDGREGDRGIKKRR